MLSEADYTRYAESYMDMVFRVALGYVRSGADADDVTQSVFLRLWRRRPDFAGEEHARNWLLRVAVNESKRLLCAPWRRAEALDERDEPLLPSEEHRELWDAVTRLKPRYRTAVYLHYCEGLSTEEIAAALGMPRCTVLTHLRRAREQLRIDLTEAER
jgi:RNA polymerase sigma-70 factor (ECF subfamily)